MEQDGFAVQLSWMQIAIVIVTIVSILMERVAVRQVMTVDERQEGGRVRVLARWNDPARSPALALLSWLPTPFSRAVPYGEALTDSVSGSWGTSRSRATDAR